VADTATLTETPRPGTVQTLTPIAIRCGYCHNPDAHRLDRTGRTLVRCDYCHHVRARKVGGGNA
jgi:aspartate carbamoyltransferase regulatory subunit